VKLFVTALIAAFSLPVLAQSIMPAHGAVDQAGQDNMDIRRDNRDIQKGQKDLKADRGERNADVKERNQDASATN
jgi:hypothetical protein